MDKKSYLGNSSRPEASQKNSRPSKGNSIDIPQISLPKGGGALKGIDEKLSVNAANGSSAFSIPLPVTPGRNNFVPALALSYNSGSGNSVFGLGWDVGFPAIQRKADQGLPRYRDQEESDIFLFSGAEDLVPSLNDDGTPVIAFTSGFAIAQYRSRIEGSFDRIEKIHPDNAETFYWKVTSKENIIIYFGRTAAFRITDPSNEKKVFKWLPEMSFDDKGNLMLFSYKKEDGNIGTIPLHDKNRFDKISAPLFTNQYLKRIRYGNQTPYYPGYVNNPADKISVYNPSVPADIHFFFEIVVDYGEHGPNPQLADDHVTVSYNEIQSWKTRTDAFSSYKAGFEIRTYRLCQRALMFHHFDELGNTPCLVKSLQLAYANTLPDTSQAAEVSYLRSVTQSGYTRNNDGSYTIRSYPPLEFEYAALHWNTAVQEISKENVVNAPVGLGNNYQWVDLYNEGISGILSEQADAWYYKSNNGNGEFTVAEPVARKPSFFGLSNSMLSMQDLDADGKKQIVSHQQGLGGFFELTDDDEWMPFETFRQMPNINFSDPETRFIDLNGDGKSDLLLTEETAFRWHASKGRAGYEPEESVPKSYDEELGPTLVAQDQELAISLADMSGDGLTDIVRIRNGEICYWPNLGYGRFGKKITMSHSPIFDSPDAYNPAYLHLADISGTGATDIIYLGKNTFTAWLNLSGNAWNTEPVKIEPFLSAEEPNQVSVVDLLGNGTACIVWSSPLPAYANAPMKFIDLMGGVKPHILTSYRNNMGKKTVVEYKSSTHFYTADKKAGKPWVTKLPFPVQCVSKLEVIDTVTDLRFTNQYTYHHGYFDHEEREFRGFGRVDQTDTEEYEHLKNSNAANATDIFKRSQCHGHCIS